MSVNPRVVSTIAKLDPSVDISRVIDERDVSLLRIDGRPLTDEELTCFMQATVEDWKAAVNLRYNDAEATA